MTPALEAALRRLAGTRRLLVASDYDGVLAPIVTDPDRAYPLPGAAPALAALAALPGTAVAVVSGRTRADLDRLSGFPAPVTLVGGHGAEPDGTGAQLDPAQAALRHRLEAALAELVRDRPGVRLETKPASVCVHTRTAPRPVAADVVAKVEAGPAGWPGVHVLPGKEVIELAVVPATKGTALAALREGTRADAVLFLGDDVTDEHAFAVLGDGDVGVKVGPGGTRAAFRVAAPENALAVLELLALRRQTAG